MFLSLYLPIGLFPYFVFFFPPFSEMSVYISTGMSHLLLIQYPAPQLQAASAPLTGVKANVMTATFLAAECAFRLLKPGRTVCFCCSFPMLYGRIVFSVLA